MKPVQTFNLYLSQRLSDVIEASSEQEVHAIQNQMEKKSLSSNQTIPMAVKLFCSGYRLLKLGRANEALTKLSDAAVHGRGQQRIPGLNYCIEYAIGVALLRLGNYSESIVALTNASECKSLYNRRLSSRIYNNLGFIFLDTEDYSKAHYYLELAWEQNSQPELVSSIPILSNLAFVNGKLGNIEKAKEQFSQFRSALNDYPSTIGQHYYHSAYGSFLESQGEIDAALSSFQQSITSCQQLNDNFFQIDTLKEYCACAIEHNRYDKLEPNLSLGVSLTLQFGSANSLEYFASLLVEHSGHEANIDVQNSMLKQAIELQTKASKLHSDGNLNTISQLYRLYSERPKLENSHSFANNLDFISSFGEYLNTHSDLTDMVFRLYKDLNTIMPVECLALGLYDEKSDTLAYNQFVDFGHQLEPFTIQCSEESTLSTYCIKNKKAFVHGQFSSAVLAQLLKKPHTQQAFVGTTDEDYPSIIMIPLILEDKVLGILTAQTHQHHAYQDYHFSLVKHLCSYISIDIQNKQQKRQLEEQQLELKKLMQIDPLSGLFNRLPLLSSIDECRKNNIETNQAVSIMLIDIDYYKQFNDCYGHIRGDQALLEVAQLLKKNSELNGCKVFRYGGDEFLIISEGYTLSELNTAAQELLKSLQMLAIEHHGSMCSDYLTLSIGAALFNQQDLAKLTNEELIQRADEVLYKVKARGRNNALIELSEDI
ncbi:diguanylate cyclase [Vibrio makurazakiensis]|uniref:diguanylate cyclase domain-containing protein n=1 Tax=Vibrio makurazakiensis TaxID=2910250 RepID=UPI003D0B8613